MAGLYLKYRPQELKHVVGQDEAKEALLSILDRDEEDIPHAFLFEGPSGVGKTTMARILAAELGCEGSDLHEMDIADFRGIDTVRTIRQHMGYKPKQGTCTVWLMDEVHKMTKDAQNALLKALEDTPEHVYFLLATTEPQALINTIKTRCTTLSLRDINETDLIKAMRRVAREEELKVPKNVFTQIAEDSCGSARMALVILDKVKDLSPEKMLAAAKQQASKSNESIELARVLMNPKSTWKKAAPLLKSLLEQEDPEGIRRMLLGYGASVLLKGDNPQAFILLDCMKDSFFYSGRGGLVRACYEVLDEVKAEDE